MSWHFDRDCVKKTKTITMLLWGKELTFDAILHESGKINIIIHDMLCQKCPKCGWNFTPKPSHGELRQCPDCGSKFAFYGSLCPQARCETKEEIIKALCNQNNEVLND